MSRTFRRKHAEQIVASEGYSRIAGVYSEFDYVYDGNGHGGRRVYREPTKQERFFRFACLHLDKGYFRFEQMKPWERRLEQKRDRVKHQRRIDNFVRGATDDVMTEKRSIYPSHYW